jgi:glycolate oxidase
MTIKRETYQALEDVVGPENISEDPVITYSYLGMSRGLARFEAVLLPQSTAEVQAIVKICNRYKIQYKASSTGWGGYADPGAPGVIKLDLRRMNRILEINEKNMYAVVEPYVIGAQLQAELMKRGLICNVTGAGSNCSSLPIVSHQGLGHLSLSGSYGERNQLALEWVTPEGEIVRMGSLGSSGEWFCGDGPGPSLRGIVRGNVVPLGGLGVFTRAATKVYHWAGPAKMSIEGVSPRYNPKIPQDFLIRYISFPSPDKMRAAAAKVGESEIGLILMGFTTGMMASNISTDNNEDRKYLKEFDRLVKGPGFLLIIAGNSPNDFEYKTQVLQMIMDQFEGESLKPVEDPQKGGGYLWRFVRVTSSIREVARASGIFGGECGGTDVFPLMHNYILASAPIKEKLIKDGWILDDGTDPFVQSLENGHQGHAELLIRFNPKDPNGMKAQMELAKAANKIAIECHFGVPGHCFGDAAHDQYGPNTTNYHLWLRKLKKTFDPNATSDSTHYITARD